jgi:hypothetical protein
MTKRINTKALFICPPLQANITFFIESFIFFQINISS